MRQKGELSRAESIVRQRQIVLPADLGSPGLVVLIVNCALAVVAIGPSYAKFF
jgi:hypothetical protein